MLAFLFFFCGWQETCRIFVHKKQKKQQGTEQNACQRGSYNFERKQSIKSNTTTRRNGDKRQEIRGRMLVGPLSPIETASDVLYLKKKSYFFNGFTDLLVACSSFTFFPKIP
jgi:hypothetical protein